MPSLALEVGDGSQARAVESRLELNNAPEGEEESERTSSACPARVALSLYWEAAMTERTEIEVVCDERGGVLRIGGRGRGWGGGGSVRQRLSSHIARMRV